MEVQLAIYDLSRGTALTLSTQFLGPQHSIPIIPHTAILAYGREYYFGSGIYDDDPNEFRRTRQLQPMEVQSLGRTNMTKSEFEGWCRRSMDDGSFGPSAYDLLNNNCNNFSHRAALEGLGLGKGVPDWILDVPRRFLSSPMGQMIRPMLEQMQMQVTGNANGGGGFGGAVPGVGGGNNFNMTPISTSVAPATMEENPWANINASSTHSSPSATLSKDNVSNNDQTEKLDTPPKQQQKLELNVLQSHNKPLLSNQTNVVDSCITQLTKHADADIATRRKELLANLGKDLKLQTFQLATHKEGVKDLISIVTTKSTTTTTTTATTFALMLLRLIVLHPPSDTCIRSEKTDVESNLYSTILQTVGSLLIEEEEERKISGAARAMAWCVMTNAMGSRRRSPRTNGFGEVFEDFMWAEDGLLEKVIDLAMVDLSSEFQEKGEVRQAASSFLYNLVICGGILEGDYGAAVGTEGGEDEEEESFVSDELVALLCGVLNNLEGEVDAVAKRRRLLVAGKILLRPSLPVESGENVTIGINSAAVALVNNLGFTDILYGMRGDGSSSETQSSKDDATLYDLVEEIVSILSSV